VWSLAPRVWCFGAVYLNFSSIYLNFGTFQGWAFQFFNKTNGREGGWQISGGRFSCSKRDVFGGEKNMYFELVLNTWILATCIWILAEFYINLFFSLGKEIFMCHQQFWEWNSWFSAAGRRCCGNRRSNRYPSENDVCGCVCICVSCINTWWPGVYIWAAAARESRDILSSVWKASRNLSQQSISLNYQET